MSTKSVVIGSDHGGFELKEQIRAYLVEEKMLEVIDVGTHTKDRVDYPDIGVKAAGTVLEKKAPGIVFCGSGIGISIACNKVDGVRCALVHDAYTAQYCRLHNDANMIAIGGRTTGIEIAKQMVDIFLSTEFEGGRHADRVAKLK